MRVILEVLAHVAIHAQVMEEIVALEDGVVFHHPVVGIANERFQQHGGHVGVVEGAQGVADVVQQGTDHIFVILSITVGQGGGLQAVLEPVDLETTEITFQQAQVRHDAIGQAFAEVAEGLGDDLPVLAGAVLHVGELGAGCGHVIHGALLIPRSRGYCGPACAAGRATPGCRPFPWSPVLPAA